MGEVLAAAKVGKKMQVSLNRYGILMAACQYLHKHPVHSPPWLNISYRSVLCTANQGIGNHNEVFEARDPAGILVSMTPISKAVCLRQPRHPDILTGIHLPRS